MRIDKFLKVSRLIKRRTIANEACDADKISVNGKIVKPSHTVKVGDVLELSLGARLIKVEILDISPHATKDSAATMYQELR